MFSNIILVYSESLFSGCTHDFSNTAAFLIVVCHFLFRRFAHAFFLPNQYSQISKAYPASLPTCLLATLRRRLPASARPPDILSLADHAAHRCAAARVFARHRILRASPPLGGVGGVVVASARACGNPPECD